MTFGSLVVQLNMDLWASCPTSGNRGTVFFFFFFDYALAKEKIEYILGTIDIRFWIQKIPEVSEMPYGGSSTDATTLINRVNYLDIST